MRRTVTFTGDVVLRLPSAEQAQDPKLPVYIDEESFGWTDGEEGIRREDESYAITDVEEIKSLADVPDGWESEVPWEHPDFTTEVYDSVKKLLSADETKPVDPKWIRECIKGRQAARDALDREIGRLQEWLPEGDQEETPAQ